MFSTEYGKFDGNSWEDFCQRCFKLKYENERYQEIPATTKGDLGIEGFTESGKAFQCYCPDFDLTTANLHKNQTKKISTDLKKIEKNCQELEKYFNNIKLKDWIFVTPDYRNKELIKYCKTKANEYKSKNLSLLDENFDVLVYNSGYFTKEAAAILQSMQTDIDLPPINTYSDSDIFEWKGSHIKLTDNAVGKLSKVIPESKINRDQKIDNIISNAVEHYLNGNEILERWRNLFPEKYEHFIRAVGTFEFRLAERLTFSEENNSQLFQVIQNDLLKLIEEEFPELGYSMRQTICNKIFYGWILECPLDFD